MLLFMSKIGSFTQKCLLTPPDQTSVDKWRAQVSGSYVQMNLFSKISKYVIT